MELSIVNTNKTPMWYLFGTKIYMNYMNNSCEVDVNNLTPAQKKTIWQDVQRGIITSSEPLDDMENKPTISAPQLNQQILVNTQDIQKAQETIETQVLDNIISNDPVNIVQQAADKKNKEIKQLLYLSLPRFKRVIKGKSCSDLKLILSEEKSNKNRKTYIGYIEQLIKKFEKSVITSITGEQPLLTAQQQQLILKDVKDPQLEDLIDIEEEQVEITVE